MALLFVGPQPRWSVALHSPAFSSAEPKAGPCAAVRLFSLRQANFGTASRGISGLEFCSHYFPKERNVLEATFSSWFGC
jgi:hypothetical protein